MAGKAADKEPHARALPTAAQTDKIAKLLSIGAYLETAVVSAGLRPTDVKMWLRSDDPALADFQAAVLRAEADCEHRGIEMIQRAAERDWKACAWLLERRWPERWAARTPPEPEPEPVVAHVDTGDPWQAGK